jgi:hypothetical protein
VRLKFNGTQQLLVYTDDVNLLRDDIDAINKNTETLIEVSKEAGLEINVEKLHVCCCFVTRMQVKIRTNRMFENVSQFKYLGITQTNQHLIQQGT